MDRILVTGGAGFIGSHVCRALLDRGCHVRVFDNLDPFYDPQIKRGNLVRLQAQAGDRLEVMTGDLRDEEACDGATSGIDGVIHLAALAGVRPSIAQPARYMDVNVTGTQRLLSTLVGRSGIPIVFGSSSSVYGGNKKVPFSESDAVDWPVSPYAASKKAGEIVCHAFHHLHGNPLSCLRFFTVYGPSQRPEMAIHRFVRRIAAGRPIPMFGDGTTARDYTFVSDIVDGVVAALDSAAGYRVYNLGGSTPIELRQLIAMIEEAVGREATLDRQPDQPGDVLVTHADTSLAHRELGYTAKVPLAEGLRCFVDWYESEKAEGRVQ